MNIEKFADILLENFEKMKIPAVKVQRIKADNSLFRVELPDDSLFLIKIGKCDTEELSCISAGTLGYNFSRILLQSVKCCACC